MFFYSLKPQNLYSSAQIVHHLMFMEGDDLSKNNLRKLNLNAPILSTRRVGSSPRCLKSFDADQQEGPPQRIPFSWEQYPGTPKGSVSRELKAGEFRPPKLPPCQWHSTMRNQGSCDHDEEDDTFSDAVDRFSMSESLCVADSASNSRGLSSLDLKIMDSREKQSPDFIIRRFLPDANAVASTYVPTLPNHYPRETVASKYQMPYDRRAVEPVSTCSSPRACGIGLLLFPRRVKKTICGIKDPTLDRQGLQKVKRSYNARQTQGASVEVFCRGGGRVQLKRENKSSK